MNRRFSQIIQYTILGLDLFSLNLLVVSLYFGLEGIDSTFRSSYIYFWLMLNLSWVFIIWVVGIYSDKNIVSFELFSRRTMHGYFYWLIIMAACFFFVPQFLLSRMFVALVIGGHGVMLLINRFVYTGICYYFKHNHQLLHQVLIIGLNDVSKKLVGYLEESLNTKIVGFCEREHQVKELTHYPILSSIDDVIEVSKKHQVSDIYSTISPEQDFKIYKIMQQADQECIHFRLIPDLTFFIKQAVHIEYLKDIPVLTLRREPLIDEGNRIRKRIFDLIISLFVVVLILSWLVPLISLLILIESKGPVFFIQQRTGKNKESFKCFKFRSMKVNDDANIRQATRNDERITRIGRFLRRTNLDELPQFFNVVKGEMSIVGPRPHMLKHTDDYSHLISKYMVRQFLKPGITGWAQVNGYRGETQTIEQMKGRVEHDLWYMENWSLWLDVKIIFLTFFGMIKGEKNAY